MTIFLAKIAYFVLSHQNASICIRMHQNVCRMNCANVLSTKLSKKWILLQFKSLKLKNYLYLFVMEDPVDQNSVALFSRLKVPSRSMCSCTPLIPIKNLLLLKNPFASCCVFSEEVFFIVDFSMSKTRSSEIWISWWFSTVV